MKEEQKNGISWRAAERSYIKKDASWYFIIVGPALLLVVISLWQQNFFFAVFIILATLVLISFGKRKPRVVDFRIDEHSVMIDHQIFDYENLDSFTVKERPGMLDEIVIKRKSAIAPLMHMPIDDNLAKKAEEVLERKLEKFEYEENFFDILTDWLGL